jgi:hypothetical protein
VKAIEKRRREFEASVRATRAAVKRGEPYIVLPYAKYLRMRDDVMLLSTVAATLRRVKP